MFGCGKFGEDDMLRYVEGKGGPHLQEHLMGCTACLDDLTEQNRIQAEMDRDMPDGMKLPGFITLFAMADKITGVWNIVRAIVSAASARWEPLGQTRGGGNGRTAVITLDSPPESQVTVRISPDEARCYRMTLVGAGLKSRTVELRRAGSAVPVYLRKAGSDELSIGNVGPGDYELKVSDAAYRVNLRTIER